MTVQRLREILADMPGEAEVLLCNTTYETLERAHGAMQLENAIVAQGYPDERPVPLAVLINFDHA
jgi:hypothetical protein